MKEPIPIEEWTDEERAYTILGALTMHTYFLRLLYEIMRTSSLMSVRNGVLEPVDGSCKQICAETLNTVLKLLGGSLATLSAPLLKLSGKETISDLLPEIKEIILKLKNKDPQALAEESWEHVRKKHPEMPSYAELIAMCQAKEGHPGKDELN